MGVLKNEEALNRRAAETGAGRAAGKGLGVTESSAGVLGSACVLGRARVLGACVLAALAFTSVAHATDWEVSLDLRGVDSNGRNTYLDGGLGKLRFDEDDSGLQLGRFRAALTQPIGEVFAAHVEATSWGDDDKNPIDLTEAFLEYRPYPRNGLRTRAKLGAFYLPMSLENRALGWETPYTITPSAIGTWVGEEFRTIGLELNEEWLGTRMGHSFELQLTGAIFAWNDPAGVLMALRGWAFDDRQTTLFGRVGKPGSEGVPDRELFHEIDGRPGYYVGGQLRYLDRAVLNVLHYDNRGDPTQYDASIDDFAWDTAFDAAALRVETGNAWTALVQWLSGDTYIAPNDYLLEWDYRSRSALIAKGHGPHLLSVRYDDFEVAGAGNESGHAWTMAYSFDTQKNWRFMLEWLRVRSDVGARPELLAEPALAKETKVELSVRYAISGKLSQ